MFSKKYVILAITILAAVLTGTIVSYRRNPKPSTSPSLLQTQNAIPGTPQDAALANIVYPQISLKAQTKQEAVRTWLNRLQQDSKADWKVPIEFYGRVVDEASRPIANARVQFAWTNLSAKGSDHRDAVSDDRGLFHLSGVEGKRLSVRVDKEGYYGSTSASFKSFEFSNPGEDIYYEPDTTDPVIFRLRAKGEAAHLTKKSVKVLLLNSGSSATIDLATGNIAPNGQLEVQTWKPWPPKSISPHYDWKVQLTIAGGGFVEAPEEFAFEAPETTYAPSFIVDMRADRGDHWNVSAEKTLYFAFGQPRKYGRLHFRTDGASRYVFIDYVLNSSGSRNLEEASTDRISP